MSKDRQRLADYLVQDAVIRNLEILGEASNNVLKHYPDFAGQHPELPLAFAWQMRNAIAHGYFKVDYEVVWRTVNADLPTLSLQVRKAISTLT